MFIDKFVRLDSEYKKNAQRLAPLYKNSNMMQTTKDRIYESKFKMDFGRASDCIKDSNSILLRTTLGLHPSSLMGHTLSVHFKEINNYSTKMLNPL